MKLSIITVSYNSSKYLEQTIKSVLNQNFPDLEYIIIDGGSTDGTIDIIKKYADKLAYWISEKDRGISNAFNKGIQKSTGEWVGIINSDDFYEPDSFKNLSKLILEKPDSKIICGSMNKISIEHATVIGSIYSSVSLNTPWAYLFCHPATFVKRNVYDIIGTFDEKYKLAMDYDWMLRATKNNIIPNCVKLILANQRIGGRSQYYHTFAMFEKYQSLIHNGYNSPELHFRMISEFLRRSIKVMGSNIKKMLGLSKGPKYKNF